MRLIKTVNLKGLGNKYQGKVRDYYIVGNKRILITTDRISAFDQILGFIPQKGAVLNKLSKFWFEQTSDIIQNHMIEVPDQNTMIVKNVKLIPIEMVVRGYISGVTGTSIWGSYEKGERTIYGIKFPEGLKKNQKLKKPVVTPTTKEESGHDQRLTREEIIKRKIVTEKIYTQMEKAALALFERGTKISNRAGIILVDTKYEFGLDENGNLILIDEIHTPDSSRFWIKKTYKERFNKGLEPENFDKEFLRLWYVKRGYMGDGKPPKMPDTLAKQVSKRYIEICEKITGEKFAHTPMNKTDLISERLHEKCALFGIYAKGMDVSRITYFGLYALQHRGQESSGIAVSNGRNITLHKKAGLVAQVYTEKDLQKLKGHMAIGHNRYSTSGGTLSQHTQPVGEKGDEVVLAHNGNLPVVTKLKEFLDDRNIPTTKLNDSELMQRAIQYYIKKGESLETAIEKTYPLFTGAFCLLVMTKDSVVALRDKYGIRPFSMGQINGGYVFASETCAFDTVSAKFLRDVAPGEMIIVDAKGMRSRQLDTPEQKLDIFEFVYFARPDSAILGKRVYKVRENLGRELAKEFPIEADVVIPVPDSSIPAAIGYGLQSKIPCEFGLIKNRYIGRTFILPDQKMRDWGVQMKLNPIPEVIKGKRVILIDDSIVRGTTAQKLVKLIKEAGAREVHLLSSCPPVLYPDFYGIDTPYQKQLIAANMSLPQMKEFIEADTLGFLSYEGMIKSTELPEQLFCTSCFTGEYPIDIGENAKHIKTPVTKYHVSFKKKKIAVLTSNRGQGSNLQAIIDANESGKISVDIELVVSDAEHSKGLERAKKANIPHFVKKLTDKSKREAYGRELAELLNKHNVDIVIMAGFMTILPPSYFETFKGVNINIHPGLVPDAKDAPFLFPDGSKAPWNQGKMTEDAVRNFLPLKFAGSTIHVVTEEADFGPVLARRIIPVEKNDTVDDLYYRLKKEEHNGLIAVLEEFSHKKTAPKK